MTKRFDTSLYVKQLEDNISTAAHDKKSLYQSIVDSPFKNPLYATHLDLGIVVLLLVNDETKTIDRVALSSTEQAEGAVRMSAKPFHEIKIPKSDQKNIIAKAIFDHAPKSTEHWEDLFTPALTRQQARFNQAGAGIECSHVYPLNITDGQGALIYSYYQPINNLSETHEQFMSGYTNSVSWILSNTK